MEITYIKQPPRKYTFSTLKIKKWIKNNTKKGYVLNLFCGETILYHDQTKYIEIRVDTNKSMNADYLMDAFDFVIMAKKKHWKFSTIILDPPYSYRKSMEKYKGHTVSKFNKIINILPFILKKNGNVITCGYHSVIMGKKRNFAIKNICLISHGGAHHDTIITNEIKL